MNNLHAKTTGFTLVEIMIVVAIIGILIAIAMPGFVKARIQSRAKACQENLSKIDAAKEQYAFDANLANNAWPPPWDRLVGPTAYIKSMPRCPSSGSYTVNSIGCVPTCSIGPAENHISPNQ